jgi:NAD(P)-dependent dehydrogenase (short-subunit alcohol dehydrogenase family)
MLFNLENKVAVVTGGGSGIGKAIAELFARQKATVCIVELNTDAAKEVANQIILDGGKAISYSCDISKQHEVMTVFESIAEEHNGVHILVNCAGVAHIGKLEDTSEIDFEKVFHVNVMGTYNCMLAGVRRMKKQRHGVILNMASVASSVGISDRFAYSMSKGAVLTMTLSVAKDYVKDGIRCNSISPARVHTPFVDGFLKKNYPGRETEMFEKLSATQPIGRMGTPGEIAFLALYLCSDEASFVTGCDYPIDGGFIRLNN